MAIISVIVPVYKVEPYLDRCVESILNQTFTDFELILVDDGSPDNCGAMCDAWAKKDSRIRVIHQENGGLSAARNAGIDWAFANSDSQWLMFVDSDDWVHCRMLESLMKANVSCGTKISIAWAKKTSGEETNPEHIAEPMVLCSEYAWCNESMIMTAWCKLYQKSLFNTIRYPVGKIHEDEFVTYRLIFAVPEIAVIHSELYNYYRNPEGITQLAWTPKRMAGVEAHREQLVFFHLHGFLNAYNTTSIRYMDNLATNYYQCSCVDNPEYAPFLTELRNALRKAIRDFKVTHNLTPQKYPHFYGLAYPKEMQIYWLIQAAKNKLRRIFHKNTTK